MLPEFGQFHTNTIFYTCDIFLSSDRARGRQKRGGGGSDPLAKSKESKKRRYPPPEVGDWLSVRGIREGTRHLR